MRVFRHPATTRASHWLIAVTYGVLAITGVIIYFHLRGRAYSTKVHLVVSVCMLVIVVGYFMQAVSNGTITRLILRRRDLANLAPMAEYYLGRRRDAPPHDGYNPLQRAAYTGLLFVLFPMIAISGFGRWPHAAFARWVAASFGKHSASMWHIVFAVAISVFVVMHITMVARTGLVNNVRSMITGWYHTGG